VAIYIVGLSIVLFVNGTMIGCEQTAADDSTHASDASEPEDKLADSFVVLPDTQFYACAYPDIFRAQSRWIADNVAASRIGVVLHTGDIVDSNTQAEWSVASDALHELDDRVPYMLVSGNHDISVERETLLNDYVKPDDLKMHGKAHIVYKDPGKVDNAFALVDLAGSTWLFIGIEFGPRDATLEWANDVLEEHADIPTVLFTHAYLYSNGVRYDRSIHPLQPYHPDTYAITPNEGIADGQDIWETLVEPHENVRLVLSGHVIPDGVARSRAVRPSGSVVYEILANYQFCDYCPCEEVEGGGGYLRIITLNKTSNTLHISTYSPYDDRFLTDSDNTFDLPL
jgi:hypothetical protein